MGSGRLLPLAFGLLAGCGSSATSGAAEAPDASTDATTAVDSSDDGLADAGSADRLQSLDGAPSDARLDSGLRPPACITDTDAGAADAGCYAITCDVGGPRSLQSNRDRLVADLAGRKCTDSCTLWSALSEAERYIFLMGTAYFGDPTSRIFPPPSPRTETALDHATALYSINAPDGTDLGGLDYNRIYLGFDPLAQCLMRSTPQANPGAEAGYSAWTPSDDVAGPHAPFTGRDMIFWYRALYDLQSEGPQFHFWARDSDFTQSGIDTRLGVCGNQDRSLTEATIAFDTFHNSDPLGDYATRGGYGWQIVDQHTAADDGWSYAPTGCAQTPAVNTDPHGGGSFRGLGFVLGDAGGCTLTWRGDAGCR